MRIVKGGPRSSAPDAPWQRSHRAHSLPAGQHSPQLTAGVLKLTDTLLSPSRGVRTRGVEVGAPTVTMLEAAERL